MTQSASTRNWKEVFKVYLKLQHSVHPEGVKNPDQHCQVQLGTSWTQIRSITTSASA